MYEAFAVIFGSLLLGILVGLTVAITLTAQFYLFIELPFKLSVRISIEFDDIKLVPLGALPTDDIHGTLHDLLCCLDSCKRRKQQAHRLSPQGLRLTNQITF
jgi:hypothetical protein